MAGNTGDPCWERINVTLLERGQSPICKNRPDRGDFRGGIGKKKIMQNLGLVLLVFAFVMFFLAALNIGAPHWNRLIAAGLACLVAAELFGGLVALHYLH